MDAFLTHEKVINDYREYLTSFLDIQDERIKEVVEQAFKGDGFLPEPLIQFNPEFETALPLQEFVEKGLIHKNLPAIFGEYNLFKHQYDAIKLGVNKKDFIVTSGTGSGKSLTFLATIFNDLLKAGKDKPKGVKAILVYPMNALINSQEEEIRKYEEGCKERGIDFPITYSKYTGQEGGDIRESIKQEKPDIILTNYMMLELIMTRLQEQWMRESMKEHLEYLVFDELHTYRGRQGADVSLLVRRLKGLAKQEVLCIGTSATMASGGSPLEKKRAVAEVGKLIFGSDYTEESIIGESLKPCTLGQKPSKKDLIEAIEQGVKEFSSTQEFIEHPLSNWLEVTVALKDNEGVLERRKPKSISQIATLLSSEVNLEFEYIKGVLTSLLKATERLNERERLAQSRNRFLPFRFHQFISQTSVVSVTLNSRENREITISPARYVKVQGSDKLLFPLLFSRISGYDFICIEKDIENKCFIPRSPDEPIEMISKADAKKDTLVDSNFTDGYIVLDEGESFWDETFEEIVPEQWLKKSTGEIEEYYDWFMPKRIYFNQGGHYSETNESGEYPLKGYFIAAKLKIDPTAGIIYDDSRVGEYTKLMKLGNEGRSTATTIISYSILDSLHEQGVKGIDQKLLSFTDNRQDASLQAGHFNDFLATIRLRSALSMALKTNPYGLTIDTISERLFEILNLKESQYARNPSKDPEFAEEDNVKALKSYLLLRLFQDLKRGWRYTLPNLEQTALLKIEYKRLHKLASLDDRFKNILPLKETSHETRYHFLYQFLNYFRSNFSIEHRMLLEKRGEIENLLQNRLDEKKLWSLESREKIDAPRYMTIYNPGRTQKGIYTASIGPQSGLGKFVKRQFVKAGLGLPDRDTLIHELENLCELLVNTGFLREPTKIKGDKTGPDGINGYLLRTDCLLWLPGDGKTIGVDYIRTYNYRDLDAKPNRFFQKLYNTDFSKYKKELEGREHTGQLGHEIRIDREERFRSGEISTLFCSPTMELGIDIANLNIVHMRNVPPNPANYAQRSGRAGRSGQAAVVFTYCSAYSPHDRNYFEAADTMVAGQVIPPRIDLANEELIKTHLHAFMLMKLGISELNTSVVAILDLEEFPKLPLKTTIKDHISHNVSKAGDKWMKEFQDIIKELETGLSTTWWFNQDWINKTKNAFLLNFDAALNRWRKLYIAAKKMVDDAHKMNNDPTVRDKDLKKEARRQYMVGLRQVDLLKNERSSRFGNSSEFYVFRYLASEGFIPGYNFTRLPIRTFVGFKHSEDGEYISRPRFIALREFGPNNIIYHNGNKYRIKRMMLTEADSLQRKIKISKQTGYAFLDGEAEIANNDPITQTELQGKEAEFHSNLIEVSESEANPQMRISCEEEERMSTGFQIENHFRYPNGIERVVKAVIKSGGEPLLQVLFGPATELIQLNRKWRKSTDSSGFLIDKRNGKWLQKADIATNEEAASNQRNVMMFARDTADTLYIQPLENLGLEPEALVSLGYALKRAIENQFQVEESELGVDIVGNPESPNILLYESAQGSLGILSVLATEPIQLKKLFLSAYKAIHFNPETRDETDIGKELPKATYSDLLSYYNQRHHDILDRYAIKEALETLMDAEVEVLQGNNDREAQYKKLLEEYDKNSSTELKFIKYLYLNGYVLPDRAQVNVPEFYISADFVFDTTSGPVLIFCDGSVHDDSQVKSDDEHKRNHLRNYGYDLIEWHYLKSLDELMKERKDIFKKVK